MKHLFFNIDYVNQYDLINKFFLNSIKISPKLQKVVLVFTCNSTNINQLFSSYLVLKILTKKVGRIITAKSANLTLKIKKGNPVGCLVVLRNDFMRSFLVFYHLFLSRIENRDLFLLREKSLKSTFLFKIKDPLILLNLEEYSFALSNLSNLFFTVNITSATHEEFLFILKFLKFRVKSLS